MLARLIKEGVQKPRSSGRLWDPSSLPTAVRVPWALIFVAKERPIKLSVPRSRSSTAEKRRLKAVFLFCLFEYVNCARDGFGGTSGSFPSALCAVHFAQQLGGYVKFD